MKIDPNRIETLTFAAAGGGVTGVGDATGELKAALTALSGPAAIPSFSMVAYTGVPMRFPQFKFPVVLDLQGMSNPSQRVPVNMEHEKAQAVGHTESIAVRGSTVIANGLVSQDTPSARNVTFSSKNGYPWQASITSIVTGFEFIREGQSVQVNGMKFEGPLVVAHKSTIREISFVQQGADGNTSAIVATASDAHGDWKGSTMKTFLEWLRAGGWIQASQTEADLESGKTKTLKAAYDAEVKAQEVDEGEVKTAKPPVAPVTVSASETHERETRERAAREVERLAAVRTVCAGGHPEIEAKAIREGWNAEKAELECLRADSALAPAAHIHGGDNPNSTVISAAIAQAGRLEDIEDQFQPKELEAAHRAYKGGISLQQILLEAAHAHGYHGGYRITQGNIGQVLRAAFSSIDIPGILSNSANKFLKEAFTAVEQVWRQVTEIVSVNDFKTNTHYRLTGDMQFEQIAPSGELKHGTLGEETYTNKADTYGITLSLRREDIINDDLGALTQVPRKIGRGAGLKINDIFWSIWLANSAFFASGNNNYATGTGTAFGLDALTQADQLFADQVDKDGKPLGVMPKILLVPTALKTKAKQLIASLEVRDTTASTKGPTANPFANAFEVVYSQYLGNAKYTGYSAKKWYLLADPASLAAIQIAFLNGQDIPIVEEAAADFNTLGARMRGYLDFGVALQDPRAAVAMKGEA